MLNPRMMFHALKSMTDQAKNTMAMAQDHNYTAHRHRGKAKTSRL